MTMQTVLGAGGRKLVRGGLMALACGLAALPDLPAAPARILLPPPAAHWRVEYELPAREEPEAGNEAIRKIFGELQKRRQAVEYKVFEDTAEITTLYEDGTREVVYLIGDYLYRHDRHSKKDVIEPVVPDDVNHRCRKVYPELPFPLSPYDAGKVEAFGRPCLYYRSDRTAPDPDDPDRALWEAWVSAETGRPVAFRHGKVLAKFEFFPAPGTPVVLPQAFADLARATFKPPPPRGSMAGMKR